MDIFPHRFKDALQPKLGFFPLVFLVLVFGTQGFLVKPLFISENPILDPPGDFVVDSGWNEVAEEAHLWWLREQFQWVTLRNLGQPGETPHVILETPFQNFPGVSFDRSAPPLDLRSEQFSIELEEHNRAARTAVITCHPDSLESEALTRYERCRLLIVWPPNLQPQSGVTFVAAWLSGGKVALIEQTMLKQVALSYSLGNLP